MTPAHQINLNSKVTSAIIEIRDGLKEPQEKIKQLNERLSNLIMGICLNEDLDDLTKKNIQLTEDFKTILLFDIPETEDSTTDETSEEVETPKRVAKSRKM